jgi:hypothetical protein
VPPIVDPETWQAVQEVIKRNRASRRKMSKYRYLFSQRVTCHHCKSAMSGEYDGERAYYHCGAANRHMSQFYKKTCTVKKYFPEKLIDAVVFDWLQEILTDKTVLRRGWEDYCAEQMAQNQPLLDELKRVEKIIDASQHKLDRLVDAYLEGALDKETLLPRQEHLKQEIKSAQLTKADLDSKLAGVAKLPQQLKTVAELELIANLAFEFGIPDERKPDLIRELDVRIELEWDGQDMWAHITCIVGKTDKSFIGTSFKNPKQ